MPSFTPFPRQLWTAFHGWWREQSRERGAGGAGRLLFRDLWEFLRDSTPERRRQRYGDLDYDWEHRVNTTGGSVRWRERLLGTFRTAYQPTEPAEFREMMASVPAEFRDLTFVDIGSGKGRTLLMASEYPFRRIVGVEILRALHAAAEENIREYRSATQQCTRIESICKDACEFDFPDEPLLVYLFNPLPAEALNRMLANLENSLKRAPRPVYVVYLNPLLQTYLQACWWLRQVHRGEQFAIFAGTPAR